MPAYRPDFDSHGRQRALEPKREDLIRVFGESSYRERVNPATGRKEWRVRARGQKQMNALREMMSPAWRESKERGRKVEALVPKIKLTDGTQVAEWTAEDVCKRTGLREARRLRRMSMARGEKKVRLRCGHRRWLHPEETSGVCPYGCGAQMRDA